MLYNVKYESRPYNGRFARNRRGNRRNICKKRLFRHTQLQQEHFPSAAAAAAAYCGRLRRAFVQSGRVERFRDSRYVRLRCQVFQKAGRSRQQRGRCANQADTGRNGSGVRRRF